MGAFVEEAQKKLSESGAQKLAIALRSKAEAEKIATARAAQQRDQQFEAQFPEKAAAAKQLAVQAEVRTAEIAKEAEQQPALQAAGPPAQPAGMQGQQPPVAKPPGANYQAWSSLAPPKGGPPLAPPLKAPAPAKPAADKSKTKGTGRPSVRSGPCAGSGKGAALAAGRSYDWHFRCSTQHCCFSVADRVADSPRSAAPQQRSVTRPAAAPASPRGEPRRRASQSPACQAAAREPRGAAPAELDAALRCLAASSPSEAAAWFAQRLDATPKSGAALVSLLQRVIGCVLDTKVAAAEAVAAQVERRSDGVADVGRLADACEDPLAIEDQVERDAAVIATEVLGSVFAKAPRQWDCTVLSFDRLVRVFHRAFIAHMDGSSRNLLRWREMESEARLPAIEEHCQLLSPASRGALLALRLVPEDSVPVQVVVQRESALADFARQLPNLDRPCVLQPYFESASGTKMVQGKRVEGGEGHGPRKEFFVGVSADARRRWGPSVSAPSLSAATPREADPAVAGATCRGNRITMADPSALDCAASREVRRCLEGACAGDSLTLRLAGGGEAERTLTSILSPATLLVDRPFEGAALASPVEVVGCEVRKPMWPIFEFHRTTGEQWFSAHAHDLSGAKGEDLGARCVALGKLLALAIVNHCKLSFALPVMFFRLLLHGVTPGLPSLAPEFTASLEDLRGFDDPLHRSLKKSLKMKASMFKQLKEVEGLPAHFSPEEYVALQVADTLMPQAMHEIRRGFFGMADAERLRGVSAEDMYQWVCPVASSSNVSIRDVFHVVMDEELSEVPTFVAAFNATLDGLDPTERRLFLSFVTGVEAPPEPKTEQLTVQLPFSAFTRAEHAAMLGMLPQAHTCSNTLELPNYYEALLETGEVAHGDEAAMLKALRRVIGQRLRVAIREASGYELDTLGAALSGDHSRPQTADVGGGSPPGGRPVGPGAASPAEPWPGRAWLAGPAALPPLARHGQAQGEAAPPPLETHSALAPPLPAEDAPSVPPRWSQAVGSGRPLREAAAQDPPPPQRPPPSGAAGGPPPIGAWRSEPSAGSGSPAPRRHVEAARSEAAAAVRGGRHPTGNRVDVDGIVTRLETSLEDSMEEPNSGNPTRPIQPGQPERGAAAAGGEQPRERPGSQPQPPPRPPSAPEPPNMPPPPSLMGGMGAHFGAPPPGAPGAPIQQDSDWFQAAGDADGAQLLPAIARCACGRAYAPGERFCQFCGARRRQAGDPAILRLESPMQEHDVDTLLQELGLA
ncbi:unnamed protein product [Prorocentrum cordatum]|uniref:HECT domain-containing protein n=1 Tax=Prorocentrum cordatum TaxID=2364126 RepID=A0ABN9VRG3_9DINO|nr:unnamed protein product [Polarella glacialis]